MKTETHYGVLRHAGSDNPHLSTHHHGKLAIFNRKSAAVEYNHTTYFGDKPPKRKVVRVAVSYEVIEGKCAMKT